MMTLDKVIRIVSKREGSLNKDICHYLMKYRYLLRDQAEAEEAARNMSKMSRKREDSSPAGNRPRSGGL